MSSGETTPALDYAPAPRISRRRIVIGVVTLGVIACAFVGWRWGPAWWDRAKLLYAQRQVMNCDPPADRVVMSNVSADVASLPSGSASYRILRPKKRVVATQPTGTRTTVPSLDYVWYVNTRWQRFPAGGWQPGPAFLHRLVSSAGEERVIVLELSELNHRLMIYCRSFRPMSWLDDGDVLRAPSPRTIAGIYHIKGVSRTPLRIYAGRADPKDPAAFSIRCESEGKSGTIHGRLGDNGKVMLYVNEPWLQEHWGAGPE